MLLQLLFLGSGLETGSGATEEFQAFASPFFSELVIKGMCDALRMGCVSKYCPRAISIPGCAADEHLMLNFWSAT